ncbi:hypothetical protein [Subtercola sp. RTI3]|uniref:hypothetical protein n=1 Tax=Subtercola sp. RTI3 TaxID=3048639 RepID=UPI002B2230E2|nr:hypothetical protein [Subtercola sp. RTI3]MEA9985674.1 hypothetical protein [Subtercola sp. RTI3]
MIDILSQQFIVDVGMDEPNSLDDAVAELSFERLEDGNFMKDAASRVRHKARDDAAEAIRLLRTIVTLSLIH